MYQRQLSQFYNSIAFFLSRLRCSDFFSSYFIGFFFNVSPVFPFELHLSQIIKKKISVQVISSGRIYVFR